MMDKCPWKPYKDKDYEGFVRICANNFIIYVGTTQRYYKYCPYCGKEIEHYYVRDNGEDE